MDIRVEGPSTGVASFCEPILGSLPEWFGNEQSNLQYLADLEIMPTLLAFSQGTVVGFLTIKEHNAYAAEIHLMGVYPDLQRQGIGRRLVREAEMFLRQRGFEYLQVKTLSCSDPDEHYAATRDFYFAMGFRPLEEFGGLWSKENPCLQMVKYLGADQI